SGLRGRERGGGSVPRLGGLRGLASLEDVHVVFCCCFLNSTPCFRERRVGVVILWRVFVCALDSIPIGVRVLAPLTDPLERAAAVGRAGALGGRPLDLPPLLERDGGLRQIEHLLG